VKPDTGLLQRQRNARITFLSQEPTFPDGAVLTRERLLKIVDEEMQNIRTEVGALKFEAGRFVEARELFGKLATSEEFTEFLTLPAYGLLEG
jgi:malate synthase